MFQEFIKTTQIGRFDGHVRRGRQLSAAAGQGNHGLSRERQVLHQQVTQSIVHRRLTVAGSVLQNPQVRPPRYFGSVFVVQSVVGHAKAAVGEQVLAIPIVVKRARLAHQLVDDVPVVDRVLVASHQSRQRVHLRSRVPDFHALGIQPGFHFLADQTAVERVRVAMNVDQAALVHAHGQPQGTVQPLRRQRVEHGHFGGVPFPARRVARGHQLLEKAPVFLATAEIPAAPQIQRLVHGRFEMPMRRLAVAVLVRLAHIDPLAGQAIVFQQPAIAGLKFALGRQVVDRRAQAVAAMPPRHAAEFPQRVLQAVGQGLERLRRAEGDRFPIRVREHEVIDHVREGLAQNGHPQCVHGGEVGGRQVTRVVLLAEHDRVRWTGRGPPVLHAPLEGAALAQRKLSGVLRQQPVEQRLGVQARLGFEPLLRLLPHFRQRVRPRPVRAWLLLGTGQCAQRAVFACGFFVHARPPGCDRQPLFCFQVAKQPAYLSIRDHRKPPVNKELRVWSIACQPGILIVAGHHSAALSPNASGRPGNLIVADQEKQLSLYTHPYRRTARDICVVRACFKRENPKFC